MLTHEDHMIFRARMSVAAQAALHKADRRDAKAVCRTIACVINEKVRRSPMYEQIQITGRKPLSETTESVSFTYVWDGDKHALETTFPIGATEADVRDFLEIDF